MLQRVQICLKNEWDKQATKLQEELEKQKIRCSRIQKSEEIEHIDTWTTVLLTDDSRLAVEWKKRGGVCIGCIRSDAFFDGAELVTDSLKELDRLTIEETLLRGLGLPVTIAQTERLVIREIAESDIECLYQISRQEGMEYLFFQSFNCFEPERMISYIKTAYRFCGYGLWGVWTKEGKLIGCCGLCDPQQMEKEPETSLELQYMLTSEERHKGYGTEMCRAVLRYAFDRIQCEAVCTRIHQENHASIRLARRLGFLSMQKKSDKIEVFMLKYAEWCEHRKSIL